VPLYIRLRRRLSCIHKLHSVLFLGAYLGGTGRNAINLDTDTATKHHVLYRWTTTVIYDLSTLHKSDMEFR
jgi:hypothetical protein